MRKLYSSLLFLGILLMACNEGGKKEQKENTALEDTLSKTALEDTCKLAEVEIPSDLCQLRGSGNFVIDPVLAMKYTQAFKTLYIDPNPGSGIQPYEWVDRCEIKALVDFFNSNDHYDGAWIVMTSDPQLTNRTSIYFVPSTPVVTGSENHRPDWAIVSSIVSPGCTLSPHFSSSSAKAAAFRSFHRNESGTFPGGVKNLLTRRIWVNACVFRSLYKIMLAFDGSATPMNGLFVFSAAYDPAPAAGKEPNGYIAKDQSTVVLVLSYQCGDTFAKYPGWGVNGYLYDKLVKMAGIAPPPVYNHGELCPNACTNLD